MNTEEAARKIQQLAKNPMLNAHRYEYFKKRMEQRNILMGDILHALKNGFIFETPVRAIIEPYYRYRMDCITPNSGGRKIGVVCIPNFYKNSIKLITVMWVDEKENISGTI